MLQENANAPTHLYKRNKESIHQKLRKLVTHCRQRPWEMGEKDRKLKKKDLGLG